MDTEYVLWDRASTRILVSISGETRESPLGEEGCIEVRRAGDSLPLLGPEACL